MARDPNARLVYSTGGEPAAAAEKPLAARPSPKGIRIRLERRPSDRVVTLVVGLPGGEDEIAQLARELKAACGTGGTVKDGVLELQGDHRERVSAALLARGLRSKRAGG
jgi:translation initiation factor 1